MFTRFSHVSQPAQRQQGDEEPTSSPPRRVEAAFRVLCVPTRFVGKAGKPLEIKCRPAPHHCGTGPEGRRYKILRQSRSSASC
jgi:hypothetical protein